jgi:hypothetical protein
MRRRRQAGVLLADLSRLSHRLVGRHRTGADGLDIQWILTCGYGFWRADWTCGVGLRIRCLRQGHSGSRMSTRMA